jgi:hypothetical protein
MVVRFIASTLDRFNALHINPPHARANSRRDFPCDGVSAIGQFGATNLFVALSTHQDHFIAHRRRRQMRNVDHHQIHRYPTQERAALTANQY